MRLDEQHRARQHALREHVGGRLGSLLGALESFEQDAVMRYVHAAHATIAGGQLAAASTSAGYAELRARASARRRHTRDRPVDVAGALERSGRLVTLESPQVVAPVLRAMRETSSGASIAQAIVTAASYAYALSSIDLQAATGIGMNEGADASGARLVGFTKELAPGCCSWCEETSGETYETADDVPFHERDACSVAPVYE